MKSNLKRYVRDSDSKKWVLFHQTFLDLQIPLSSIEEVARSDGSYRVFRTSNRLVYFKHFNTYDLKVEYTYVS